MLSSFSIGNHRSEHERCLDGAAARVYRDVRTTLKKEIESGLAFNGS